CRGLSGDGRGPTSKWVNPQPGDYRQGLFKFTSVKEVGRPASRRDLRRTLEQGIEGTSMPSFTLLSGEEIENLISYVIHLGLRGMAEFNTIKYGYEGNPPKSKFMTPDGEETTMRDFFLQRANLAIEQWAKANDEDEAIVPNEYPFKDVALDKIKISNKEVDLSNLSTEEHAAFVKMRDSVQS